MFEISVKDDELNAALGRIAAGLSDTTPLARVIAGTLASETERNFAAQGRPAWLGLKPATIFRRTRAGTWPGKILQVSGKLAASVATDYGRDYARVGSNRVYAAIQQFGGQAGRGRKTTIPARPYLPIDAAGNLQAQARTAVLDDVNTYLRSLVTS